MLDRISAISPVATDNPAATRPSTTSSFGSFFSDALARADQLHSAAQAETTAFLAGQNQDIHTVAIAVQRAELQIEYVQQVKNKLLQAYQEIMRSPL